MLKMWKTEMSQSLSLVTHKHRVCDLHLREADKGEWHRAYLKEGRGTVWRLIETAQSHTNDGCPAQMHNTITSSRMLSCSVGKLLPLYVVLLK